MGSLYLNAHFSTILFGDFIPGVILVLFIFPAITSILSFYQKNYTEKMHKDYYRQVSRLTQKKQALSLLIFLIHSQMGFRGKHRSIRPFLL
ncbi:hypothetical protein DXA14_22725 [Hungatella hathewayi]|nr:hypothetical protein DXA14_22725 [Hungatella hathewayi]RHB76104.1 hypothetical protein DW876_03100 [Hungatella hathewayi]